MKLSDLQKYILKKTLVYSKTKLARSVFVDFYKKKKSVPAKEMQVKIITQSLERLIEKGLIIGYGHKTPEKYFITDIKLTLQGKKIAKSLFGKQIKLPFKIRIKK